MTAPVLCSVTMVEGTVCSLLEDAAGNIVGVEYRDKSSGKKKASRYSSIL